MRSLVGCEDEMEFIFECQWKKVLVEKLKKQDGGGGVWITKGETSQSTEEMGFSKTTSV